MRYFRLAHAGRLQNAAYGALSHILAYAISAHSVETLMGAFFKAFEDAVCVALNRVIGGCEEGA